MEPAALWRAFVLACCLKGILVWWARWQGALSWQGVLLPCTTLMTSLKGLHESIVLLRLGLPLSALPQPSPNVLLVVWFSWLPLWTHPLVLWLADGATLLAWIYLSKAVPWHESVGFEGKGQEKRGPSHDNPVVRGTSAGQNGRPVAQPLSSWIPYLPALIYFWNPFSWMTLLAGDLSPLCNALLLWSIYWLHKDRALAGLVLFLASCLLFLHPIALLPACVVLFCKGRLSRRRAISFVAGLLLAVLACTALLGATAFLATGSVATALAEGPVWMLYGRHLGQYYGFSDMTPNIGLFWYLFVEMLKHFGPLFLFIFHSVPLFLGLPLAVRFRRHPWLLLVLLMSVSRILRPYPILNDLSLFVSFLPLIGPLFPLTVHFVSCVTAMLLAGAVMPVAYHWWTCANFGNVNFLYSANMTLNIAQTILVLLLLRSQLLFELKRENAELLQSEADLDRVDRE